MSRGIFLCYSMLKPNPRKTICRIQNSDPHQFGPINKGSGGSVKTSHEPSPPAGCADRVPLHRPGKACQNTPGPGRGEQISRTDWSAGRVEFECNAPHAKRVKDLAPRKLEHVLGVTADGVSDDSRKDQGVAANDSTARPKIQAGTAKMISTKTIGI